MPGGLRHTVQGWLARAWLHGGHRSTNSRELVIWGGWGASKSGRVGLAGLRALAMAGPVCQSRLDASNSSLANPGVPSRINARARTVCYQPGIVLA